MFQSKIINNALSISIIYLLVSSGWIFYSDSLLVALVQDKEVLAHLSIVKGWLFVLVTAALLYLLINRSLNKIRLSRDYHLKIFEDFPSLIWRAGTDGRCDYFNKTWLSFTGRNMEEEVGDGWAKGVHPHDLDRCLNDYRESFDARKPFLLEYRLRRYDGEYRWLRDYGRPIYGLDGSFSGYIGSCYDVTEQKEAEADLFLSEQRFRELTENTSDWIWEVDRQVRYVYASPKVSEILGYGPSDLLGKTPFDFMSNADAKRLRNEFKEIEKNPRPFKGLVNENLHRNGSLVVLETSGVPIYDDEGRFSGFRGVDRDITSRKEAEERIKALNTELVERAEALEDANAELEAFAHTVSHDLRAPLTNISLSSQVMLDLYGAQIPSESKDIMQTICDATERMDELISALLNFSLASRSELKWETVDLSAMAFEVISELRMVEPDRKVDFSGREGVTALGDGKLLRVVMVNLFSNAWKYTAETDGASIEFGMTEEEEERTYFVRDNGIGFDMNEVDQLFRAFKRLDGGTHFKGHGVGLATVQRIVQRHGGRTRAEGRAGEGATFYFTLPVTAPSR